MSVDQKDLERLKHELAITLESQKWMFRKEELQYLEAGQHQRSLNQLMWQIPSIAIAITGGLWFGATSLSDNISKVAIFSFTAGVDFLTIFIILRLRQLIQIQIDFQKKFSQQGLLNKNEEVGKKKNIFKTGLLPNRTVIFCWGVTLFGAAFISLLAIFNLPSFSKSESKEINCCICTDKNFPSEVKGKMEESADRSALTKTIVEKENSKSYEESGNTNKVNPPITSTSKVSKRKRVICKS